MVVKLKLEKLCHDEFYAYLTSDEKTLYKHSSLSVTITKNENEHYIVVEKQGLFTNKSWLVQEVISLIKLMM